MLKPIPSFVYSKANQIFMILFVPLFALAFIVIYRPTLFESISERIGASTSLSHETVTLIVAFILILSGMALSALSRMIMSAYTKRHKITYIGYIVWIVSEVVVMATIFSLFSLFTHTCYHS